MKKKKSSAYNGAYKDIINLERPKHINDAFSAKHPSMKREDRAKIFASFAALKGYEEAIDEAGKVELGDGGRVFILNTRPPSPSSIYHKFNDNNPLL